CITIIINCQIILIKDMDNASINSGEQIFEKTISGMYLGEIVRRLLVKMAELGDLFDNSCDLIAVGSILSNKFEVQTNLSTRKTVVEVIDTIVKRGGRLAGAGIVGILQKMEQHSKGLIFGKRTKLAMDGGLYENYPQYREYLQDAVTELLGSDISKNVIIEHSKDGSGIGAALLSASNSKYTKDYLKAEDILLLLIKGPLIKWTKEFNIADTIGEDVVACLVEAVKNKELDMFTVTGLVRFLANDTSNVFIEFSEGLPLIEFDQDLGTGLGKQMISGKCLGVIVCRILLKMAESKNLFGEHYIPSVLRQILFLNLSFAYAVNFVVIG
ncbi:hypothetical protein MKX01_031469, partial [Papaver californicum]